MLSAARQLTATRRLLFSYLCETFHRVICSIFWPREVDDDEIEAEDEGEEEDEEEEEEEQEEDEQRSRLNP